MSARRAVWEVARRELVERSRSRALRVSLILLLILSVGGAIAAARLTGRTPTDDVGLVGPRSVALEPAIRLQAKAAGRRVHLHPLANATAASRALRAGSIDVVLLDGSRILVKTSRSQPAVRVVQGAAAGQGVFDRLRSSGLSQAQALGVLAPRALPVQALEPRPRNYDRNKGLISVSLFVLFMALIFFGQAVAQGVTEEKSSRVVELLLTTVSPRRLLAGKILGVGLLGLALLVIPGAAALAAGSLAGGAGLPSAAPKAVALVLLWFVLGYAFYSVAFAAVGALVSRQEDLNTAILPLTAVLTGAFYIAFIAVNTNPNGMLASIAAFLPPLSPMVVPARIVLGDMTAVALALALALEVLAIAGMILLAAHIYERAILRIGAPVKLRRLIAPRSQQPRSVSATANATQRIKTAVRRQERLSSGQPRLSPKADLALRLIAAVLWIAGVVIGLGKPISIALVAVALLLLIIEQILKHLPRRPVH
jgi:ABC-2 type transport system permease protein